MMFFADGLLCLCCLCVLRWEFLRARATSRPGPIYPIFWALLALVLGLLAMQEATGWLNLITGAARRDAMTEGWYHDRRPFQWLLIKSVPIVILPLGLGALWLIRKAWQRYVLVVAAILYWTGYAVTQGISFHNIDWLLRRHTAGVQNKTWGDLVGLALTAAALLIAWQMDRPRHPSLAAGRSDGFTPQMPIRSGIIRRFVWTARKSLLAEQWIFGGWFQRYREDRRRRAPRKKVPNRRK